MLSNVNFRLLPLLVSSIYHINDLVYNKPEGTGDFYSYMKDKFLKEAMEYFKKSND